jgi:hypothetical protein
MGPDVERYGEITSEAPTRIVSGCEIADLMSTAENMDATLIAQDHILVPKELFTGLLDNTRELIGTQQWRKGTTTSNDRTLDALEQEVAQAEHLLQNQLLTDEVERLERELEQAHAVGMRRAAEICRGLLPTHEQMQRIEGDGFSFSQTTRWCYDKIIEEAGRSA